MLAYQGSSGNPTFITALNSEGTGWQTTATSSNTSAIPQGLTNGIDAVALNEIDNAIYNGTITNGDKATILGAINNKLNWSGHNTTLQDFTGQLLLQIVTAQLSISSLTKLMPIHQELILWNSFELYDVWCWKVVHWMDWY